ncbi:hypothetical protein Tco_0290891 [Tanacetum coccineum]
MERQKEHKRKSAARGVAPVRLWQEGCFRGKRRLKGSPSRGSGGSNEGLPHFCSPPLGGEQGKKKLINQLSLIAYLHPGYGAASVSMQASLGSLLPGKQTSSAPGSCQLPRPDETHDALSNQCRLVYLDLLLRRYRMASWDSNLVDSFIDHI